MEEQFGIAAFRSRQHVMQLERALKQSGVPASIITTPRSVSVGCGLSVRFELQDAQDVYAIYRATRPGNLIGFYQVFRQDGRTHVQPMGLESSYHG